MIQHGAPPYAGVKDADDEYEREMEDTDEEDDIDDEDEWEMEDIDEEDDDDDEDEWKMETEDSEDDTKQRRPRGKQTSPPPVGSLEYCVPCHYKFIIISDSMVTGGGSEPVQQTA
jgi:hypothetical protein